MFAIIRKIVVLKIQTDLLVLKLIWKFAVFFLKIAAVIYFLTLCAQLSDYSERAGWFVFLLVLFMAPRFDKKKELEKNVILP